MRLEVFGEVRWVAICFFSSCWSFACNSSLFRSVGSIDLFDYLPSWEREFTSSLLVGCRGDGIRRKAASGSARRTGL